MISLGHPFPGDLSRYRIPRETGYIYPRTKLNKRGISGFNKKRVLRYSFPDAHRTDSICETKVYHPPVNGL